VKPLSNWYSANIEPINALFEALAVLTEVLLSPFRSVAPSLSDSVPEPAIAAIDPVTPTPTCPANADPASQIDATKVINIFLIVLKSSKLIS
jgi:hypothetical protein